MIRLLRTLTIINQLSLYMLLAFPIESITKMYIAIGSMLLQAIILIGVIHYKHNHK